MKMFCVLVVLCALVPTNVYSHDNAEDCGDGEILAFPHFANGRGTETSFVIFNSSPTEPIDSLGMTFWDSSGTIIDPGSILDLTQEERQTRIWYEGSDPDDEIFFVLPEPIGPLGQVTISTNGEGPVAVGYVSVFGWDEPVCGENLNGVARFSVPGYGAASVLGSPVNRDVPSDIMIPARWKHGVVDTGLAIVNGSLNGDEELTCSLKLEGVAEPFVTTRTIPEYGHIAGFISEWFPISDIEGAGTLRCSIEDDPVFDESGLFAVGLDFDYENSVFTTLPVVPVVK